MVGALRVTLIKTLGVIAAGVLIVVLVKVELFPRHSAALGWALASTFALSCGIVTLLAYSLVARQVSSVRLRRSARLQPLITELLATSPGTQELPARLRELHGSSPREVEECLVNVLSSVTGSTRQHYSAYAVQLGLVARWERRARSRSVEVRRRAVGLLGLVSAPNDASVLHSRLSDPDDRVRLEACRILLRDGVPAEIASIFLFATSQPLFVRALLAQELRPHALTLAKTAIPDALALSGSDRVRAALEIVASWQKVIPLAHLGPTIESPDPELRSTALRTVPWALSQHAYAHFVLRALEDSSPGVAVAAAWAAARMHMQQALEPLRRRLSDSNPTVARAAAEAIASIAPHGEKILEQVVVAGPERAAYPALEALAQLRIGGLIASGV